MSTDVTEYPWEGQVKNNPEEEATVPNISLDYFFLGADQVERITRNSAQNMSTQQLRRNLKTAKLPANGTREEWT